MPAQLETLTRRLELKQVRQGKESLPAVVGFLGQLLVDCNLAHGKVALQIVPLRKPPLELELESGAPTDDSLTIDEPSLHGKLRVHAANPARALRILYRSTVRQTLSELLEAQAQVSLTASGLHVEAPAADAETALPIATKALRLMEALDEASREEALRAESERAAAKELPLPEGQARRFVALRDVELDDRKLEKLKREARARVYWRKSAEETREALLAGGASETLADELITAFTMERDQERRRNLVGGLIIGTALLVCGVLASLTSMVMAGSPYSLLPFFVGLGMLYGGVTKVGRTISEFTRGWTV